MARMSHDWFLPIKKPGIPAGLQREIMPMAVSQQSED
jgi:hypothetical protein